MTLKLFGLLKKYFFLYNAVSLIFFIGLIYALSLAVLNVCSLAPRIFPDFIPVLKSNYKIISSLSILCFIYILLKIKFYSFKEFILLFEKCDNDLIYKISAVETAAKHNPENPFAEKLTGQIIAKISEMKCESALKPLRKKINLSLIIILSAIFLQFVLFRFNNDNLVELLKKVYSENIIKDIVSFRVIPGSINIIKGETLTLIVKPVSFGKNISAVNLNLHTLNGIEKIPLVKKSENQDSFSYQIKNIISDVEYSFSTGNFVSKKYRITAYTKPVVNVEYMKIIPPVYANLETELIYSFQEKIEVLKGSGLEIKCSLNFDPETFYLKFNNSAIRPSVKTGRNFVLNFNIFSQGFAELYFESGSVLNSDNKKKFFISLKKDSPPNIRFDFPEKDETLLPDNMLGYFAISAEDDYGISSGKIFFKNAIIGDSFNLDFRKNGLNYNAYYTVDFSKYDVMPGDEIYYCAEVFDNDAVSGFKKSVSKTFKLKIPSVADLYNELNKEFNYSTNVMGAIQSKNEEIAKSAKKLINDLMKSNNSDWSTQKQIKELLDAQKKIESEIKEIQSRISKAIEQYKKNREMLGEETLEKISKLNKLMNDIMNSDVKNSIMNFQAAFDSKNNPQKSEFLKNAVFNKEEFGKKLDRTISLLNKLKLQNTVKNIQKNIDELMRRQNDISNAINKNDLQSASAQQDKLASELQKIENAVDDLKNSSDDKQTQKLLDSIKQTLSKLREKSNELSEKLKNANNSQSEKNTDKSSNNSQSSNSELEKKSSDLKEKLSQLADRLNNMLAEMTNKEFEKFENDLNAIILKMINLQKKNLELKNNFEDGLKRAANQFINSGQFDYPYFINLCQEYQNFIYIQSSNYFQLTIKSFVFPPEIIDDFKYISDMYGYITDNLKNKSLSSSLQNINAVMKSVSNLIFKLLKIKEELNKENQSDNSSNMSERLDQLAKAQQSLNSMSFNFDNLTQEQLEQMSYEQSLIRQSLEQMINSNSNSGDALQERLQKLVDEMNKIEKSLKRGNLNKEVKESQKSVYDKLLDASRSLKKETENQDKRESKSASETKSRPAPPEIFNKNSAIPDELKKFNDHTLPEYYKKELNDYYKSLLKIYEQQNLK
ncbi:MAG TPA: hypothetical protein PKY81_12205 [bacterium]|nr:hypothetical protein [bacterium]HPN31708.1 hypothetical protein [bacterium]